MSEIHIRSNCKPYLYAFQSNLHFIGNPPFGRQSSLAKKFIKHICSCDKTKTIAFILPKSFKKDSLKKLHSNLGQSKITQPMDWELNDRFKQLDFQVYWGKAITKHGRRTF